MEVTWRMAQLIGEDIRISRIATSDFSIEELLAGGIDVDTLVEASVLRVNNDLESKEVLKVEQMGELIAGLNEEAKIMSLEDYERELEEAIADTKGVWPPHPNETLSSFEQQ